MPFLLYRQHMCCNHSYRYLDSKAFKSRILPNNIQHHISRLYSIAMTEWTGFHHHGDDVYVVITHSWTLIAGEQDAARFERRQVRVAHCCSYFDRLYMINLRQCGLGYYIYIYTITDINSRRLVYFKLKRDLWTVYLTINHHSVFQCNVYIPITDTNSR